MINPINVVGFVSQSPDRPRGPEEIWARSSTGLWDKKHFLSDHLKTKLWCHFTKVPSQMEVAQQHTQKL